MRRLLYLAAYILNNSDINNFGEYYREATVLAKKDIVKKEKPAAKEAEGGNGAADFVVQTKEELGKVVWPSRQQLISESAAVILMVILVSTIIYLIDNVFAWGAGKVF